MTEVLDRIRGAMVGLKMPRALEALDHTMQKLEQGEITAIEAIDSLLSEEYSTRETRRIDIALRTSKLLPIKTLESFDFSFQPSLDRERIAALAPLDFIRRAEVVHFLGPPGTGKSHLATALGVAAVKAGMQVSRATLAELVEVLTKAERQGQLAEKIRYYARSSLLIVAEIGDLPITQGGANLVFQLVNARYEKGAMIMTSTEDLLNGATSSATQLLPPRFWIGCYITPSLFKSKAPATGCAVTRTSSPNTPALTRPSRRHRRLNAAAVHPKMELQVTENGGHPKPPDWGILLPHF